jgi:NADPH:quinone reductase-like Zn-dependent oxidoreductase
MQGIRIRGSTEAAPYSAENPAPASGLFFDTALELPKPANPGELLIRVHAATVTRDELTWPETYTAKQQIPGYDFAGSVVSVFQSHETAGNSEKRTFKPGDEVYGMKSALSEGCTWAEYAIVRVQEAAHKATTLNWAEAVTVPMSALTAWQALFVKAGLPEPELVAEEKSQAKKDPLIKVLITGASGAVGSYLVQLGAIAGLHIVAASTSNARNEDFLRPLGADEVLEYGDLEKKKSEYDVIIDTVGGSTLERCWQLVKDHGRLITIDSSSYDFVEQHRKQPFAAGKEDVNALFFIVEGSGPQLEKISKAVDLKLLHTFVAQTFPISRAREAYDAAGKRVTRRGKVVLTM